MPNSGLDKKLTGAWGEQQAAQFLRRQGYDIIGLNYRVRGGEIDIIARRGRFIVFAEVKTRRSGRFAAAREFVTAAKQRRLLLAAQLWLAENPTGLQPRFDVMEIICNTKPAVFKHTYIENAFEAEGF